MSDDSATPTPPHKGPQHAPPEQNPLAGGCPVAHGKGKSAAAPAAAEPNRPTGCPIAASPPGTRSEPSASGDARVAQPGLHPFQHKQQHYPGLTPQGEDVPENSIPAAGRGNSDDGKSWLNPSANQVTRGEREDNAVHAEG